MRLATKFLTGSGFLLLLVGLGTAEALFTKDRMILPSLQATLNAAGQLGVAKMGGVPVEDILKKNGIAASDVQEQSLIARVAASKTAVHTVALLKNNDRIALMVWIETPDVKDYFQAIKDALHASFSPAVTDLKDVTDTLPSGATRNSLSFKDPAIGAERMIFVRIRQQLFEFHVTDGKDKDVQGVIEALSS